MSALSRHDLDRRVFIDVSADGACFIRDRGAAPMRGTLPMFSTDTHEEAESLIVLHCRLARDGSGIYRLNDWNESDGLGALRSWAERFRVAYGRARARKAGGRARRAAVVGRAVPCCVRPGARSEGRCSVTGAEWEALRKMPEAVALRAATVAWVSREGGEVRSDARLLDAAIALADAARASVRYHGAAARDLDAWLRLREATRREVLRGIREHGRCSGDWHGKDDLGDASNVAARILRDLASAVSP